jgi:SAM-dependent methyltransferase
MLSMLRRTLAGSDLFAYNLVRRDRWMARQAAQLAPGSKVLDVGAGSCPYRELLKHCEYRAQDFSGLSHEQLRHGTYGAIDYVCDAINIPVPDASFDAVVCTEVLEHHPEPIRVVRELGRLLRPGGKLILTAPLGSGIHQEPYHYYGGYTPYWYQRFLPEAGFEQISIEANEGSLRAFAQESIRFLRTTIPFRLRAPWWGQLAWSPIWLLLAPFLGLVIPLATKLLDRFDTEKRFTVGYHVTAVRSASR